MSVHYYPPRNSSISLIRDGEPYHGGEQLSRTFPLVVRHLRVRNLPCTSGFRGSMLQAIKLGQTGDLTGTNAIAWEVKEATPYVPSPLLYGEQIYVLSVNKAIVSCYNAKTGEPYYTKQEMPEIKDVYASPIGAAGRVYFVGRNGVTYVLKNSENFEVLAVNKLDDGIDCSPAIIGDEMYLKSKQYLYCLKASQPASD